MDQVRRDALARLCDAQAAGMLSLHVFEERYALVKDAETAAGVMAIVADLPTDPGLMEAVSRPTLPLPVDVPASIRIPSILGSTDRAGTWVVPEHIETLVILGELKLDFRDAHFTSATTVIDLSVILGTITIVLPPGTQVENECREVLASSKHTKPRKFRGHFNDDLVVLRGSLFMAELIIKEAPPTGTPRRKMSIGAWLGLGPGEADGL